MAFSYTLGQLTDETFRKLRGTTRDTVNTLSGSIDAPAALTQEIITFTANMGGITQGSLLVVGTETMYVMSVNDASYQATVLRGYDDTTPATAVSGAIALVDPAWTRSVVQGFLREELRSWAPQIFTTSYVDIPLVAFQRGYDLGNSVGTIIQILKANVPQPPYAGTSGDIYYTPGGAGPQNSTTDYSFSYDANANIALYPSGKSLTLNNPALPDVNGNLHVVYATPFNVDSSWTETTDMIANVGMDERDLDIPPIGAAARLLRWVSVRRAMLNVAGTSRNDQDVTMPAILQAAQQFELARNSRLGDARLRMLSDWPYRNSIY